MQQDVSVLIIEDEAIWAKQLEIYLRNLGYELTACYNNAADAMVNLDKTSFDIALLDIRMNGSNVGISIGKMIQQMYKKPFIFITSGNDKETIEEAIAVKPSAFLIKPVSEASLYAAIQTALDNYTQNKTADFTIADNNITDSFFVKNGNTYKRLNWDNIAALAVDGRYTKVITSHTNEHYLINSSLTKTISTIIPKSFQHSFLQINRTEAINISHIQQLKGDEVVTSHHTFSVSENYMQQLKRSLNIV